MSPSYPSALHRSSGTLLAVAALSLTSLLPAVQAAETGLSNFPAGAQTSYAALLPPPGTTSFFGYALYFQAESVRDTNGDTIPGVDVEFFALAPRLVHSWEPSWAGFKLSSGVLVQGLYAKVTVPGADDDALGPSLFGIEPLYLTRSFGAWHFLTGGILYWPIGSYDRDDLANTTLNYQSYAYQASVTWTPTPNWEASINYGVEFKETNDDTNYRSGDTGNLTFGFGHRPFQDKRWDLGVSGYYTHQMEDDKQNGVTVGDGNRTRRFGIGPKLVYWVSPAAAIVAQWHRETNVRNAPRGDLFWLECVFPLWGAK